jgi:DNA-binding NarL/FixJ family response regulator
MNTERVPVFVHSDDQVLQIGVATLLRNRSDVTVVEDLDCASVAVVVTDDIDEQTVRVCLAIGRSAATRVAIVASNLDESSLLSGVDAGVCAFLRRSEVTGDRLVATIRAALTGEGSVPPDLIGRLLAHVGHLKAQLQSPKGLSLAGFSDREIRVLRMVADGYGTAEIADRLCFSERTVKGIIHEVTTRFQLKNRAQAVAYAARQGLI